MEIAPIKKIAERFSLDNEAVGQTFKHSNSQKISVKQQTASLIQHL